MAPGDPPQASLGGVLQESFPTIVAPPQFPKNPLHDPSPTDTSEGVSPHPGPDALSQEPSPTVMRPTAPAQFPPTPPPSQDPDPTDNSAGTPTQLPAPSQASSDTATRARSLVHGAAVPSHEPFPTDTRLGSPAHATEPSGVWQEPAPIVWARADAADNSTPMSTVKTASRAFPTRSPSFIRPPDEKTSITGSSATLHQCVARIQLGSSQRVRPDQSHRRASDQLHAGSR